MRFAVLVVLVLGCDPPKRAIEPDAPPLPPDGCAGLECQVAQCTKQGLPPTTISGTVFAPNGTLPLYGATVYIPLADPGELHVGTECARCTKDLPGGAFRNALSDERGNFLMSNVPHGVDLPIVVQIGKWRRRFEISGIQPCQDNPLPEELTRLPKNKSEGDIPRMAIVTGQFDALECLVRKLGVDVDEFTSSGSSGAIHMYASNGATSSMADAPLQFERASMLWGSLDRLKQYDLALFSCEGETLAAQKTQQMMDTLKAYADFGGRVFLSHYHNIWIVGDINEPTHAPAVWPTIATCDRDDALTAFDVIDQNSNPKGPAFAKWMLEVGGSSTIGIVPVSEGRLSCRAIDLAKAERWMIANVNGGSVPQMFQFTTPNEIAPEERCGKVVFSDMHVASGSTSSAATPFPNGCSTGELTAQEKALAFMFFDVATCVGQVF